MFSSPKKQFLKKLLVSIENNYILDHSHDMATGYSFEFESYSIDIKYDKIYGYSYSYMGSCRVTKGWEYLTNDSDEWFFNQLASIIKNKEDERQIREIENKKAQQKLEEESMNSKYLEYIEELQWIIKKEWTEEFDEVIQDTKRLQEIAQEAKKIHSKYTNKFLWLFW